MAAAAVVAVLLPTTAYILRLKSPPARKMIDGGIYVLMPCAFCFHLFDFINNCRINLYLYVAKYDLGEVKLEPFAWAPRGLLAEFPSFSLRPPFGKYRYQDWFSLKVPFVMAACWVVMDTFLPLSDCLLMSLISYAW